ncbi:MAG: inositol monophosphatase family protein [Steroidobacteraceae bacterium]
MQPLLNIAVRAARRAAEVIVRSLNRLESLEVSAKGRNDFVSEVDRAAEAEIIATIRRAYPDHAFLAEESGSSGESSSVWIIDPLDGTTNFLHGFPTFSVSIACRSAASSRQPSSTIPCARRSSPPRAAPARTSTSGACASASSARSKAR